MDRFKTIISNISIVLIGLVLPLTGSFAQETRPPRPPIIVTGAPSILLKEPLSDVQYSATKAGSFIASDKIMLQGSFATNGKSYSFKVDEKQIFEKGWSDYLGDGNVSAIPAGTATAFGTIPGAFDVSSVGAATYQLPIEIGQGTGGMQPSLSLVYNSMAGGEGLAGVGWNISGLSSIGRVGKSIWHDGTIDGVKLNTDDRLAIDGMRMVEKSGNYWAVNSTYTTEVENYTTITYQSGDWFEAVGKDGKIAEYGRENGSKNPWSWLISSVRDLNGNYIKYYYRQSKSVTLIDKIEYTGNINGKNPINAVNFFYDETTSRIAYANGIKIEAGALLRKVSVMTDSKLVREYQLAYYNDNGFSVLSQVIEKTNDGSILAIKYNYKRASIDPMTVGPPDPTGNSGIAISGDFNGDGLIDYINYPKKTSYTSTDQWNLYVSVGNGFSRKAGGTLDVNFVGFSVLDVNRDGKDEIFWQRKYSESYQEQVPCNPNVAYNATNVDTTKMMNSEDGLQYSTSSSNGIVDTGLIPIDDTECYVTHTSYYLGYFCYAFDVDKLVEIPDKKISFYGSAVDVWMQNGDFNGDGEVDYMFFNKNNTVNSFRNFYPSSSPYTRDDVDFVYVIDFNGNGKADILFGIDRWINVVEYNPKTKIWETLYHGEFLAKNMPLYPGDFNGDGKTDFIQYVDNTTGWKLYYSDGLKYLEGVGLPIGLPFPYTTGGGSSSSILDIFLGGASGYVLSNRYFFFTVSDFNGDGISDFMYNYKYVVAGVTEFRKGVMYGGFRGCSLVSLNLPYFNEADLGDIALVRVVGDINGDGIADLYAPYPFRSRAEPPSLYLFNNYKTAPTLTEIVDGYGNATNITYARLNSGDAALYRKATGAYSKDILSPASSLRVVKSFSSIQNGIKADGSFGIVTLGYKGMLIHTKGRGFLGFEELTRENSITQQKTVLQNELLTSANPLESVYTLIPKETKTYLGEQLVSSSTQTNRVKLLSGAKRYQLLIDECRTFDEKTRFDYVVLYQYDDYGNNILTTTRYSRSEYTKVVTTWLPVGGTIPNRPSLVTTTRRLGDEDPLSSTTKFEYDLVNGNLKNATNLVGTPQELITEYSDFDVWGNPKTVKKKATVGGERVNTLTYDDAGRYVKTETNPLLQTVKSNYNFLGQLESSEDILGKVTRYSYDGLGRLVATTLPDGRVQTTTLTKTTANDAFYSVETKLAGEPTQVTYYDRLGRAIREESGAAGGKTLVTTRKYNENGQLEMESKPFFSGEAVSSSTYGYSDPFGRTTSISSANGTTTISYSGSTVTTTLISGETVTKDYDELGRVTRSKDNSGEVAYLYGANGKPKTITTNGRFAVELKYDAAGNRSYMKDPSSGVLNYTYNGFGEQVYKDQNSKNQFNSTYDALGRLVTYSGTGFAVENIYNDANNQLSQVKLNGVKVEEYTYGDYARLTKLYEKADDREFTKTYEYDQFGNLTAEEAPNKFKTLYSYDSNGFLTSITGNDKGVTMPIWTFGSENSGGQPTKYKLGSGISVTNDYENDGFLKFRTASVANGTKIIDYGYSFDNKKGVLNNRSDYLLGKVETFEHDNACRLTNSKIGLLLSPVTYDSEGRISSKFDVGNYTYGELPYAPSRIEGIKSGISLATQDISYTGFGMVDQLKNAETLVAKFTYGADMQRCKMVVTNNGVEKLRRYYSGNYEEEVANGVARQTLYISSPYGPVAAYIVSGGTGSLYFLHTDHLGSVTAVTDAAGLVKAHYSYDSWGRRRNPDTWSYTDVNASPLISRGYTFHEHLDDFGLINANGRFYDPILGQFISPDPLFQTPNGYSYCLNNPLLFTDPNGTWFGYDDLIAAGVGAVVGYVSYGVSTGNWGWKAVAAAGAGAAIAWIGWNTMGAGTAALTHGAGSATSFSAGASAVFGSSGGYYGVQFGAYTFMNSYSNREQLKAADKKGWGGVAAFAVYSASAVLSTSLKPGNITRVGGLKQLAGVVLTDNMSDNMDDGTFNLHSLHVGPVGYNFDSGDAYSIFSKGLSSDQRFDMGFETILALSALKTDVKVRGHYQTHKWQNYLQCTYSGKTGHWNAISHSFSFTIPLATIGYYSRKGYELGDMFTRLYYKKSLYQYWYDKHYDKYGNPIF